MSDADLTERFATLRRLHNSQAAGSIYQFQAQFHKIVCDFGLTPGEAARMFDRYLAETRLADQTHDLFETSTRAYRVRIGDAS
jgi:hypothetical protein